MNDDRHEHDADAQRRRRTPARRSAARRRGSRCTSALALVQVAVDVLDLDRRVVDQDADRQRHAAERHDVERLPERHRHDDRHQDRQRDRDDDDQRAPPATRGTAGSSARSARRRSPPPSPRPRPLRGRTPTGRTAASIFSSVSAACAWMRRAAPPSRRLTTSSVDALPCLQDRQQHAALAVGVDHVGLHREAVADVGDVADVDRRAVDRLDRQVVESRRPPPGCS